MSENASHTLTVYLILGAIVLVTLILKGYIKLPITLNAMPAPEPIQPAVASPPVLFASPLTSVDYMARATLLAKQEAEKEASEKLAKETVDGLKARFAAPFSTPDPAGPEPASSGK